MDSPKNQDLAPILKALTHVLLDGDASNFKWEYTLNLYLFKCHPLIAFTNSLDPGQARQNERPDLDPNSLTL